MGAGDSKVTRRQWLAGAAGAGLVVAGTDALAVEPRWLDVTVHRVAVPGLPASLNGYTIAQLTDVHLDSFGSVHGAIAREIATRSPQLVVFTGDIVDTERTLPTLETLVDAVRARGRDVLATMGNWEHWGEVHTPVIARAYERAGARLLTNESRLANGLLVAATDDHYSEHADVPATFRDVPRDRPYVFLTHAPGLFDQLPRDTPQWALGLAGHTHGGQVRVGTRAIWVPPASGRFVSGDYATMHGPVYVSRGIGTSIAPVRVMCRPELPFFILERA
jgi:predicted MPP superfamily phosphohydrolase